jgi:steroid 5-alpha reductase family enzyme
VLIGIGSPWWWVTIAGVVVMYVFLTRVTGIPYTEQQAIRSRGDAYRRYQETTNVFFPFSPSKISEEQST